MSGVAEPKNVRREFVEAAGVPSLNHLTPLVSHTILILLIRGFSLNSFDPSAAGVPERLRAAEADHVVMKQCELQNLITVPCPPPPPPPASAVCSPWRMHQHRSRAALAPYISRAVSHYVLQRLNTSRPPTFSSRSASAPFEQLRPPFPLRTWEEEGGRVQGEKREGEA